MLGNDKQHTTLNVHVPVLLKPILSLIDNGESKEPTEPLLVFDGTFGGGGYSLEFLKLGHQVFACDLDKNALERFQSSESKYTSELTLKQSNFSDFIAQFNDNTFDLIMVDLGFSNNQLKIDNKGFSYQELAQQLDLRYNEEKGKSVAEFLNTSSVDEISKVIYTHSGELFARKIALKIGDKKQEGKKMVIVKDLVECVLDAIPEKFKNKKNQVLSRVWQSLRIHVNEEFVHLEKFLEVAPNKLKIGGFLCVVNFHSLEDRLTTKNFREISKTRDLDDYGNKTQDYILLTKKPIVPDETELLDNPQSRSATLRIIMKNG
jgi:16S rRNA (cytosine1402-N4)-methyltransferase